jgi:hypothetical protein
MTLKGIPFAVCRAESMRGSFGRGIDTAWVFEGERAPGAGCSSSRGFQYAAVGTSDRVVGMGGRIIDYFSEDASKVSLLATTDIDGHGTDEIAISLKDDTSDRPMMWMLRFDGKNVVKVGLSGIGGSLSYSGGPAPGTSNRREGGEVAVYSLDDTEVARTNFEEGEGFAVAVDPGTYRVAPSSGDAQCRELTVEVVAHQFTGLRIKCGVK